MLVLSDFHGSNDVFTWLLTMGASLLSLSDGDDPVIARTALVAVAKAYAVLQGTGDAPVSATPLPRPSAPSAVLAAPGISKLLEEGFKSSSFSVLAAALQVCQGQFVV